MKQNEKTAFMLLEFPINAHQNANPAKTNWRCTRIPDAVYSSTPAHLPVPPFLMFRGSGSETTSTCGAQLPPKFSDSRATTKIFRILYVNGSHLAGFPSPMTFTGRNVLPFLCTGIQAHDDDIAYFVVSSTEDSDGETRGKRAASSDPRHLWPNATVPYIISPSFTGMVADFNDCVYTQSDCFPCGPPTLCQLS